MAAHPPSLCFSATRQRGPTVWNRCRLLSGNGIGCSADARSGTEGPCPCPKVPGSMAWALMSSGRHHRNTSGRLRCPGGASHFLCGFLWLSLTSCFSGVWGETNARQPLQRFSPYGKPLKRLRRQVSHQHPANSHISHSASACATGASHVRIEASMKYAG